MPGIEKRNGVLAKLKADLEHLAKSSEAIPQLSSAIQDMLTAVRYADKTLLLSSANALFACLADTARDIVKAEVKRSDDLRQHIKKVWREDVDGITGENFDDLKEAIESVIDKQLGGMIHVRENLVGGLEEAEHPVDNTQELDDSIRRLRQFREDLLKNWPSSNMQPSPLNRQAIDEARTAIRAGEKGMRKDELLWRGDSQKQCG